MKNQNILQELLDKDNRKVHSLVNDLYSHNLHLNSKEFTKSFATLVKLQHEFILDCVTNKRQAMLSNSYDFNVSDLIKSLSLGKIIGYMPINDKQRVACNDIINNHLNEFIASTRASSVDKVESFKDDDQSYSFKFSFSASSKDLEKLFTDLASENISSINQSKPQAKTVLISENYFIPPRMRTRNKI